MSAYERCPPSTGVRYGGSTVLEVFAHHPTLSALKDKVKLVLEKILGTIARTQNVPASKI